LIHYLTIVCNISPYCTF